MVFTSASLYMLQAQNGTSTQLQGNSSSISSTCGRQSWVVIFLHNAYCTAPI